MIIAQIHNKYKELTDTEQKVASFILSQPEAVTGMTAKELSEQCGTVPSAIIRFCKSIGTDGFSELKIQLAKELGKPHTDPTDGLPAFCENDSPRDVFSKVFGSGIRTLRDTLQMLDFDSLEKIIQTLRQANRILILGVGTSSVIAVDAQYRFSQLGLQATSCTDVLFMNVSAINLGRGDVALCISHSGRTRGVVDAMRHAKEAGATTVAITSFAGSPLAKESDFAITVFADEENYPVEAVSARVAHICLVDALMMSLATMDYETFKDHVANRNKILGEIRY